jgi:hypothetical protein
MIRRPLALLALALVACADAAPVQLRVGRGDSVVVNHTSTVPLPLTAVAANGARREQPRAQWRQLSGPDLQLTDSGTVTCTAAFDARVRVQVGTLTKEAVVRCRPIRGVLFFDGGVQLRPGDAPREYPFYAIGLDNQPVQLIAGEAAVLDTSVAELVDGKVRAKRAGTTDILVKAGDCRKFISVMVRDTVSDLAQLRPYSDYIVPLRLVSGEYQAIPVPAGHLIVRLDTDSLAHDRLALGVLRANCARMRPDPQHLSCMTGDTSVVVVRRRPSAGAGSDTGRLIIARADWGPTAPQDANRRRVRAAGGESTAQCPHMLSWTGR